MRWALLKSHTLQLLTVITTMAGQGHKDRMTAFRVLSAETGQSEFGNGAVDPLWATAAGPKCAPIVAAKVPDARSQKLPFIQLTKFLGGGVGSAQVIGRRSTFSLYFGRPR